jgi:putative sporulation protein YyaC
VSPVNLINTIKTLFPSEETNKQLRISINEPLATYYLSKEIKTFLKNSTKPQPPIILCIGTDRATGDSLGPLTGWQLQTLLRGTNIEVLGTVDNPVHAANLKEVYKTLTPRLALHPLLAIDACLGHFTNVGTIVFQQEALKPGTAVKKDLPEVGDAGITGIVNVSGLMEMQVIQNTRLSLVLKMSQIIAHSIYLALR